VAEKFKDRADYTNASYIYGSAVRAPEVQIPEVIEPEKRQRGDSEVIRDARAKVEEKARQKRKSARSFSAKQVMALTAMAVIVAAVAAVYLLELSGMVSARTKLNSLEKKLTVITEENALLENAREGALDLTGVYDYAIAHGMRVPEKQQVITYKRVGEEYVVKDGDIPNE